MLTNVLDGIDLAPAFTEMVTVAGDQLTVLLPIGIGLMLIIAVPRLVRRLVGAFI
jgi:hypothetical protein